VVRANWDWIRILLAATGIGERRLRRGIGEGQELQDQASRAGVYGHGRLCEKRASQPETQGGKKLGADEWRPPWTLITRAVPGSFLPFNGLPRVTLGWPMAAPNPEQGEGFR